MSERIIPLSKMYITASVYFRPINGVVWYTVGLWVMNFRGSNQTTGVSQMQRAEEEAGELPDSDIGKSSFVNLCSRETD